MGWRPFIVISAFFVYRSVYGMRFESGLKSAEPSSPEALKAPAKAM